VEKTIPEEIRDEFEWIKKEVIWLHGKWTLYLQLFGHSQERIDMLNECSSACFYAFSEMLLDSIQLSFSKLTDPASTTNRDQTETQQNLSLEQLQKKIKESCNKRLSKKLGQILEDLRAKCKLFRQHRNKSIAHPDYETALKRVKLESITRESVDEALVILQEFMNAIELSYRGISTIYSDPINYWEDGNTLVAILKAGLTFQDVEIKWMKKEKINRDDLRGRWPNA
jgi:hypothetical protein